MGKRKGFTFVEIALFLAITAALFIGIALGMQNSIFRQRYNDTAQNFFEFMRSIYSKVSNPQSAGKGDSRTEAIYGKLVVFGETTGILGEKLYNADGFPIEGRPIFTYDVIGDPGDMHTMGTGNVSDLLAYLGANVVRIKTGKDGERESVELVSPEKYEMRWQSELQNIDGSPFIGSILVVRHPRSGTINTLVMEGKDGVINANELKNVQGGDIQDSTINYLLIKHLDMKQPPIDDPLYEVYNKFKDEEKFKVEEVNFCVSPYAPGESGSMPRQNIRILANARNASSVQFIDQDDLSETGNKCEN